jgi:hypothetical protein
MDYFIVMFKSHLDRLQFAQLHQILYKIHDQNIFKVPEPKAIIKILDWNFVHCFTKKLAYVYVFATTTVNFWGLYILN